MNVAGLRVIRRLDVILGDRFYPFNPLIATVALASSAAGSRPRSRHHPALNRGGTKKTFCRPEL